MDFLDDFLLDSSAVKAPARPKFQPKAKPQPKKGPSVSVPSKAAPTPKEQPTASVPVDSESNQLVQSGGFLNKNLDAPNSSSLTATASTETKKKSYSSEACNSENVLIDGNLSTEAREVGGLGIIRHSESSISKSSGDAHLSADRSLGSKFPQDIIGESTTAADWPADGQTLDASTTQIEEEITIFTEDFIMETSTAQSDSEVPQDMDSRILLEETGKHGERKTSDALNFSHESFNELPASPGLKANEDRYEFLDDDMIRCNSNSPAEVPDELAINTEKSNEDYLGDKTSKKKRPKKSKKVASENDKGDRKRRKQSKTPDDSSEKPPKKFPHATRRKRVVNKSLLEVPEDEIDFQRVPIRDLIILAEYKERQAKKAEAVVQPPSTNERTDSSLPEDLPYEDDDLYGSDQDTGPLDNPSITRNLKDTSCFNYQTNMKRQKQVRWSKQDTELFYQGVRQFGSDLSLIAELFPGRDRSHIKSKYKKEERQHPMRLHDALTSRATDHSHFELVIQRLQERAAQEATEEAQSGDDNIDEEEELDEQTLQNHEEAAKSEQKDEGSVADEEPDRAPVTSPPKSYDDEDDFDWIAYESK